MDRSELIFLHGGHTPKCTARVDKFFTNYWALQFMDAGAVSVRFDNDTTELSTPSFWCCGPGPRIAFEPAAPAGFWSHRYVAFTGSLAQWWHEQGLLFLGTQPALRPASAAEQLDLLFSLRAQTGKWSNLRAINLLEQILLTLAEARRTESEPWLKQVQRQLAAHTRTQPDYARIAADHGMSLSTFRRRFHQAAGIPVHAYVLQIRLEEARHLVSNTDMPLKLIAARLGYRDLYYFTRQFRHFVGVPPGTYRNARQH